MSLVFATVWCIVAGRACEGDASLVFAVPLCKTPSHSLKTSAALPVRSSVPVLCLLQARLFFHAKRVFIMKVFSALQTRYAYTPPVPVSPAVRSGWLPPRRRKREGRTPASPIAPIAIAVRAPLTNTLDVAGEFLPFQEVELHAKVAGYIRHISVDIGDKVKAGQVLATLDIPELTAQVARRERGRTPNPGPDQPREERCAACPGEL